MARRRPAPTSRKTLCRARTRGTGGVLNGAGPGLLAVLTMLGGCRDDEPEPGGSEPPPATSTSGETEGSSTGLTEEPSVGPSDLCGQAPSIGPGMHLGSLRGHSADLGGACGLGGPDAFFRLDVSRRSDIRLRGFGGDFVPRVGVLPHTCAEDWHDRTLLCDQGVGTWLLDVPAGSSLIVSVGIDSSEEVLGLPPPSLGPDPLSFSLEVRMRNVLDVGDSCEPAERGRCGEGTACVPPPPPPTEPNAPPGPAVCTVVEGDSCASAVDVPLPLGITTVEIDPTAVLTDAHEHSCGGARRRDRVLALALPSVAAHQLQVRSDRADVGLALRSPGCLLADERACTVPDPATSPVLDAELSGGSALLFIELPPHADDEGGSTGGSTSGGSTDGGDETGGEGEEAPIIVELEVSEVVASG